MPQSDSTAALEYQDAKALADSGAPARVFLMAAMLAEDSDGRLAEAYPALFAETMRRRWDSRDGSLPGDDQVPRLDSLGRDD